MKTMIVTNKLLKNMPSGRKACKPARKWFKEEFPNGADWKDVWDSCLDYRWQVWFTANYLPDDDVCELMYIFVGQALRYVSVVDSRLDEYADNVTSENIGAAYKTLWDIRDILDRTSGIAALDAVICVVFPVIRETFSYAYLAVVSATSVESVGTILGIDVDMSEQVKMCWEALRKHEQRYFEGQE